MITFVQKKRQETNGSPVARILVFVFLSFFGLVSTSSAQLSVSFDILHVPCGSAATGKITAIPSGGVAPYQYVWSTGATTASLNRLRPGTYTVTITDAASNTLTANAVINGQTPIAVTIDPTENCSGPVTVTAAASGGIAPYKYAWDMGTFGASATISTSGYFCVTVSDANNCGRIECIRISVDVLSVFLTKQDISCPEGTNGAVSTSVGGGVAPYTYLWSNGATTPSINGLAAGTYRVTVTDARGCSTTNSTTVTAPAPFIVNITSTGPSCPGEFNGSITVNSVTGGTPPYSYLWNSGQTTSYLNNVGAATFTLTIRDGANCVATRQVVLTARSNLQLSSIVSDETCPDDNNGSITVVAQNGVAPYTYAWSSGGASTATRSNLAPGTYTITVTDAVGCQKVTTATVDAAIPFSVSLSKTDATSCLSPNGTASVTITGGSSPFSYQWSNGAVTGSISNAPAGTYVVTVTDGGGCAQIGIIEIEEPPAVIAQVTATNQLCAGLNTGTASASVSVGTAPYSYLWNTGATTSSLSNLIAGTYRVTVTDAQGCSGVAFATITQRPKPNATVTASGTVCGGLNIGTASVSTTGGTPTYSYIWNTGATSTSLSNLGSGTYIVTVTDFYNCRDTAQGIVDIVPLITLSTNVTNVACFGGSTGIVEVVAGGGRPTYTYAWNNGAINPQIIGVLAGSYSVTVTDAAGCTANTSVTVTQPSALGLTLTHQDILCADASTSSANIAVTGGVGPYTYLWSSGATSATVLGLSAGAASVTVTDANNCQAVASTTILSQGKPSCTIGAITAPTPGESDGSATVSVTGGTAPYSILWANGQTTATATGLAADQYSVTITDANGCQTNCAVAVTVSTGLIGDFVWYDLNQNGLQDPGESGVPNILVILVPISGSGNLPEADSVRTDAKGKYRFIASPGSYKITFILPDSLQLTTSNNILSETRDSDADRETGMTAIFQVEAGKTYLTWDAGVIPAVQLIPSAGCICLNNATSADNGQFTSAIELQDIAGENWRIIQQRGMFLKTSPAPPSAPLPISIGTTLPETSPGFYKIEFIHVDGKGYAAKITNGIDTVSVENTCSYPEIRYGSLPNTFCYNGAPHLLGLTASAPGGISYELNNRPISSIEPSKLGLGVYNLVVRLNPTNPLECDAVEVFPFQVTTQNCPVKIGDFAWLDIVSNGKQDATEKGIPGIEVYLKDPARPGIHLDTAITDSTGHYCFYVLPGNYQLGFKVPAGSRYTPTAPNAVLDDAQDSDIDTLTGMTPIYTVWTGLDDLSIDAGFIVPCENVTDPGVIGYDQTLCGPGVDPSPLLNLRTPSGGVGNLEYVWMVSYVGPTFNTLAFNAIPNSNSPTYDPGPLYKSAYFARCVRREGCALYLEPEVVKIIVKEDALANVIRNPYYCKDKVINLRVETKTETAEVKWELYTIFGEVQITPRVAYGKVASFVATTPGQVEVRVTVTENGCTIVQNTSFIVTTSPAYCTTGDVPLTVNGLMDQEHRVNLRWRMRQDFQAYTFQVEHAADGENWQPISEVQDIMATQGEYNYYEYAGNALKNGRNFYRVTADDGLGNLLTSNMISLAVKPEGQNLAFAYPNPVSGLLILDVLKDIPATEPVQVDLIQSSGAVLRSWALEPGHFQHKIDCTELPNGLYFVRVQAGSIGAEVIKVIKE